MRSAQRLFLALLSSIFLFACSGGGSISDDGNGGTDPVPVTIDVNLTSTANTISKAEPATLTATVKDSEGNAIETLVTFSLNNDTYGTFTPLTGEVTTNSDGVATIQLNTAQIATGATVTATTSTGESATLNVTMVGDGAEAGGNLVTAVLVDDSGATISQISAAVSGVVKVTYTDSDGNGLESKVVSFTSDYGVFTPTSGTALTDSSGVASIAISAGSIAGSSEILIIVEENETVIGFTTLGDEVEIKPIDSYTLEIVVNDTLGNENRDISQSKPGVVVATLLKDNLPAAFETITFTLEGEGVLNPTTGTALTDNNGEAIIALNTGNSAGAGTVTAQFNLDSDSISEDFNVNVAGDAPGGDGEANELRISLQDAQSGAITTNVSQSNPGKVVVNLVDKDGLPLTGKVITFSSTLGSFLPTNGTALTDSSTGEAFITLTAGTIEGAGEVTATYGDTSAVVGFVTAGDDIDPVEASPAIAFELYDCNDATTWDKNLKNFEVCTVTDNITNDRPGILGATITRSGSTQVLEQVLVTAGTTIGAISPNSGTAITNSDGKAILDLYSNGDVGAGEVSLKVQDVTATKAFEIGRVDISLEIETAAGSDVIPAGGSTIVTVTVFNPDGSLSTGQPFSLEFTSECVAAGKAVIDTPVVTNGGKGYATYRSTGCEGDDTITVSAITGGSAVTASTAISIDTITVGAIEYVSATPTQLALRGTGGISQVGSRSETSVVSFRVINEIGQAAASERVCFELSTELGGMTLSPSPLAQDYDVCSNMPKAGDAEYPSDITSPNKYAVAYTDANGDVQVTVHSGDVPTAVKVFALWDGSTESGHNAIVSNISDQLVISTGLADNNSFSLSATVLNVEGWEHDNEKSTVNILAADHFNNLVPAGTVINFRTEGGAIDATCETGLQDGTDKPNGGCSLDWRSQDPRPFSGTTVICPNGGFNGITTPPCTGTTVAGFADGSNSVIAEPRPGRSTILAYAIGEESFVDLNGNGLFDAGEPFTDLTEAFIDHNNDGFYRDQNSAGNTPAGAINEEFIDYNTNSSFDVADGFYTGLLCAAGSEAACTDTGSGNFKAQLNVFRNMTVVMSGSTPYGRFVDIDDAGNITDVAEIDIRTVLDGNVPPNDIGLSTKTVYLFLSDLNNNTLASGTTITATTENGELSSATSSYTIGNNTSMRPLLFAFTVGRESSANQKTDGNLTITVQTLYGDPVTYTVNVKDNG
ncbi:invasin [Shewanella sp. 10N.286.52.B9]|uniref:beta strand repeat-containing protein n=1 Tax=Shewanella sp. 10N.286.52.B9 TaxID=1880837 RepID=UPI000C82132D|nr:invasin [Shewanella sp. 10N.286.52.B9]PMG42571.1 invasin [Shewanella sp. 10N.286.52.B9]